MAEIWDAKMYQQFLDARTRPARDLLAAIPTSFQPKNIYDLGCGPGNSTILLKNRWPQATLVGLDSSLDMLQAAKSHYQDINFIEGNIVHFSSEIKIDCLFANASLQWIDEHEVLFPKLFNFVNHHGILAIQMPNNFHCPSHQISVKILQSHTAWKPLLKKLRYGALSKPLYYLPWYYDVLTKAGANSLQLWETEYSQEMSDHQAIYDWMKGTGLRPILTTMDMDNQLQFAKEYTSAISQEYPKQENNRVLFPFRRIFVLANKT